MIAESAKAFTSTAASCTPNRRTQPGKSVSRCKGIGSSTSRSAPDAIVWRIVDLRRYFVICCMTIVGEASWNPCKRSKVCQLLANNKLIMVDASRTTNWEDEEGGREATFTRESVANRCARLPATTRQVPSPPRYQDPTAQQPSRSRFSPAYRHARQAARNDARQGYQSQLP